MKRITAIFAVLALAALLAFAQSKSADKPAEQSGDAMMNCPMMGMMKQMGVQPETIERMQLLMRTPIFLDSPCPFYAQADKLNLSERQKNKLGEIENEAAAKGAGRPHAGTAGQARKCPGQASDDDGDVPHDEKRRQVS